MSDVTQLLTAIERGEALAADQLLPLGFDELRKLATSKMAQENPGQTLQATALVHEAFVRLWMFRRLNSGTVEATSLRRRLKPCDEYWSRMLGDANSSNVAGISKD